MRKSSIALLIVAMLLLCTIDADAWVASRSKFVIGDVVFGNDVLLWKPTQTMFHQQTLAASDTEAMAIAFPAATRIFDNGAVEETGVSIAQTSDEAVVSTATGFFKANWCFNGFTNNGGFVVGDVAGLTPVLAGPMIGSGLIWPYMTAPTAPGAGVGNTVMSFKPIMNTSDVAGNVTMTPSSGINNTPANTSSPTVAGTGNTAPWKSNPPLNYKAATKDQIKNASSLEKMWRNANVKSTMPQAYNGTVDRPNGIDPKSSVLKMSNRSKAIPDAIKMTNAGEDLHTLLWDL